MATKNKDYDAEIEVLEQDCDGLRSQIEDLHKDLLAKVNKIASLKNKRDKSLYVCGVTPIDWEELLNSNAHTNSELKHIFIKNAIELTGLRYDGYDMELGQYSVEIAMTYNDPESFERTKHGIETLLPYIKPSTGYYYGDGYKVIKIFEHTCSEHGSYHLKIKDGVFTITRNRFNQREFKDLDEAIHYIQDNHWYDGRDDYSDDED